MTDEEYKELLPGAHNGNADALAELWLKVKGYGINCGKMWIKNQTDPAYSMDDLVSMAAEAMLMTVKVWEPKRTIGEWFLMYKWQVLRQIDHARSNVESYAHCVSMSEPVPGADDLTIEDTLPDTSTAAAIEQIGEADEVNDLLAQLPVKQQEIIRRCVLGNDSLKSVAAERGVSFQAIQTAKERALKALKKPAQIMMNDLPSFGMHKGVAAFNSSGSSAVDDIVVARENAQKRNISIRNALISALGEE